MNIEFLQNISHKGREIASEAVFYGKIISIMGAVAIIVSCQVLDGLYRGVRGRWDRDFREKMIQEMMARAYWYGIDPPPLSLSVLSKDDRPYAQRRIEEACDDYRERGRELAAMSDKAWDAYAGQFERGIMEGLRLREQARTNLN